MHQIRVLQPAGSAMAADLAKQIDGMGIVFRVRRRRARRRGHVLVYLDITIQKGSTDE